MGVGSATLGLPIFAPNFPKPLENKRFQANFGTKMVTGKSLDSPENRIMTRCRKFIRKMSKKCPKAPAKKNSFDIFGDAFAYFWGFPKGGFCERGEISIIGVGARTGCNN